MPYFDVGLSFTLFIVKITLTVKMLCRKNHLVSYYITVVFLNNKKVSKQYENSRWSIEQTCLL